MAYGMPDQPVSWDYSHILRGNQTGAYWAQGIQQVGNAFAQGIQGYYEKKQRQEKEDATVAWLEGNRGAVDQLFPQLSQVQDPAERRKVIKAGIKGAGLDNLVQVQGFMDQQKRQAAQDAAAAEMQQLRRQQMEREAAEAQARMEEVARLNRSTDSALNGAEQLRRGVGRGVLRPEVAEEMQRVAASPAGRYRAMGGRITPEIAQEMMKKEDRFVPGEIQTPSGLPMVQTSPNSWVPDPRVRQQTGERSDFSRAMAELDASGAWDKPAAKLNARERALMRKVEGGIGAGASSDARIGSWVESGGEPEGETSAADLIAQPKTQDEIKQLPKGTRFTWKGKNYVKQ